MNINDIAKNFNLTQEQLLQLVAMLQNAQPEQGNTEQNNTNQTSAEQIKRIPEQTPEQKDVPYYETPEYDEHRRQVIEAMTIDVPPVKYAGFSDGDISDVKEKGDFYDDKMYEMLYLTVESETMQNIVKSKLEEKALQIGGNRLAQMVRSNCTTKKKEIKIRKEKEREEISKKIRERDQERERERIEDTSTMTKFTNLPSYCTGNRYVGAEWTATDAGVYRIEEGKNAVKKIEACGRPILINNLLEPIDRADGVEKMEIVYRAEKSWRRMVVERGKLVNVYKIMDLADYGVAVNSDRARALTNFLTSMMEQSAAMGAIPTVQSSSKLALYKNEKLILPYREKNFIFEEEQRFPRLVDALTPQGGQDERNEWFKKIGELRQTRLLFFQFEIASVLAGPILGMLHQEGFVCNIFGLSGTGKSVVNKIAASFWGNYNPNAGFVYSALNTTTSIEILLDALNCIPLIVEDFNQLDDKKKNEFKQTIMQVANGYGKGRATKNLGLARQRSWEDNCVINSEEPIRDRTSGGAANRVYTCPAPDEYPREQPWRDADGNINGTELMEFFATHYGYAGVEYIDILNKLGKKKIYDIKHQFEQKIAQRARALKKSERQIAGLAVLLTADYIGAKYLFQDDIRITADDAMTFMEDQDNVNQYEKFYNYAINMAYRNPDRFDGLRNQDNKTTGEIWGVYKKSESQGQKFVSTIAINRTIIDEWARQQDINTTMFCDYLARKNLLYADRGRRDCRIKYSNGTRPTSIKFKLPDEEPEPQPERAKEPVDPDDIEGLGEELQRRGQQMIADGDGFKREAQRMREQNQTVPQPEGEQQQLVFD